MISSDSMRGFNDLLILLLLYKQDSYGYQISKDINHIGQGIYELKETTLYSAIKRLEKNQLIVSYEAEETFGRKRSNYRISKEGIKVLKEKLREWEEIQILINNFINYSKEEQDGPN